MKTGFRTLLVLLFALTMADWAAAQQPALREPAASPVSVLGPVATGTRLRIRTGDGRRWTSAKSMLDQGTLRLEDGTSVPVAEIDSVWLGRAETGRGARTGAIVGGIIGTVSGGLYLATVVAGTCETDDCQTGEAAVVGGALGAAGGVLAGAAIGFVIGSGAINWRLAYPEAGQP